MKLHINTLKYMPSVLKLNTMQAAHTSATTISRSLSSEPAAEDGPALADLLGRRHNYLRISLTERCNLRLLHAGGGRAAVAALGAADARGAGAAGARVRGARRRQAAPHRRRAHAAQRPGRHHPVAARGGRHPQRVDDDQRAGADAAAAGAAARGAERAQHLAGLAARRPLPAHGAPPGAGARAGGRRPGAAARVPARQDQHRAHEGVQRRRDLRLRGVHARPRGGGQVHRVHAVLGQRVGRRAPRAAPRRAGRRAGRAPRAAPRRHQTQRHRRGVAGAGLRGQRGVHLVHDAALLRLVQPAAAHRRRQPEGVPVRRQRGVAAGRGARRRLRPPAGRHGARRAAQQAAQARRHAESCAHGEPADDSDRRIAARHCCGWFTVRAAVRCYSTLAGGPPGGDTGGGPSGGDTGGGQLSHLDAAGRARMVDVGRKPVSARAAAAECRLRVGARLLRLLRDRRLPKGDALTVAEVAGVMAAKRTAELIPLCHPLPLEQAVVRVELPGEGGEGEGGEGGEGEGEEGGGALLVRCEVRVSARTGAEMEALTGAAVAALTLYDMCKAVDKDMRITDLCVVYKTGGKGDPPAPTDPPAGDDPPRLRSPDRSPLRPTEIFAPTNIPHF